MRNSEIPAAPKGSEMRYIHEVQAVDPTGGQAPQTMVIGDVEESGDEPRAYAMDILGNWLSDLRSQCSDDEEFKSQAETTRIAVWNAEVEYRSSDNELACAVLSEDDDLTSF